MKYLYSFSVSFILIFVSLTSLEASAKNNFTVEAVCPDPPSNDDPCPTSVSPPLDLTTIGTHTGTTCCARGAQDVNTDGTPADHPNFGCNEATEGAAVWYVFTPNDGDEGYDIKLTEVSGDSQANGPVTMEVYWATDASICEGFLFEPLAVSCVDTEKTVSIGNCPAADQKLFIKIATAKEIDQCGEFQISVEAKICDSFGKDECNMIVDVIAPVTNEDFILNLNSFSGCLGYACPDDIDSLGGCPEFGAMPTVWFQVITDSDAAQMFTTVEPEGNWDPIWSIYSGTSCNDLTLVDFEGSPPCSNGDLTPELHQIGVFDDVNSYWVAVTVDPASIPADGIGDGAFEFSVATTINAIICLGEEVGDCSDPSLEFEIIARENEDGSLDGPFCQGEEVTVNVNFFYDASESGADWFIGLVPMFGNGWDLESLDYEMDAPIANGVTGLWYEEGTALAPIIQEDIPILCTYRDEFGELRLCNMLCESCTECDGPTLVEGDPLPSGYFWVTNGGNSGCENDGSPGEGWGVGSVTAMIEWTFTIKTRIFEALEGCEDKGDLTIAFQTFSDGVAGCWEDPIGECILDRSMVGPGWEIGCTELPPEVVADDITICSGDQLNIPVNTIDGSVNELRVKPINNQLVNGENSFEFEGGTGFITDQLTNLSSSVQVLQYKAFAIDSTLVCNGLNNIINVTVLPAPEAPELENICSCDQGCTTLTIDPMEGYSYQWMQDSVLLEEGAQVEVCPTSVTIYHLSTTDTLGCTSTSSLIVDCLGLADVCNEEDEFKIQYSFFIDVDGNGLKDSTETYFADGSFVADPEGTVIYNNTAGETDYYLAEGNYSFIYNSDYLSDWFLTTDSVVDVFLDSLNNCVKVSFGLNDEKPIRDVYTYYNLFQFCNSDREFTIYAKNTGTVNLNGILWVELDEQVMQDDFFDVNMVDTLVLPNKVGWYFSDLVPGQTVVKDIIVHIPGPPDFPIGGLLDHKIYTEINVSNNTTEILSETIIHRPVVCSYDPNDKQVDPYHPDGYTDITQSELTYKVRFQNTGNAAAMNITILDTLSEYLDVSSVRYLSGSHDEYLSFTRNDDNILAFRFSNINLPDSLSDPAGSQGHLIYSVHVKDDLPEGTNIENTAHIYFDYNPPIVTNTTNNILYDDLDEDGFYSIEDCNDSEAAINPDAEEIPNNDVDEDCDGTALIIDNDMDGFNSDEDCNDENADINPGAEEIINNLIDENCDGLAVVIDNDNDGFNSDEDCDDDNPDINPDAEEIPNNDVDEDCDGVADITDGVYEVNPFGVELYPNPTRKDFTIQINDKSIGLKYEVYNTDGKVILIGKIKTQNTLVDINDSPAGIYFVKISSGNSIEYSFFKLLKI